MAGNRSVDQIRADMAKTRERVTESVQGLVTEVDPRVLSHRAVAETKSFLAGEAANVKHQFVGEAGVRWRTVGAIVGGVALAVTLVVVGQTITQRQRSRNVERLGGAVLYPARDRSRRR